MRIEEMPSVGAGYAPASVEGTVTSPSPKGGSDAKSERRRWELLVNQAVPSFEFSMKPRAKCIQISEQIAAARA